MMKRQIFAITLVLFMVGLATASTTLNVPGSYANIQAAINASVNGDTVMVAPGTYTGSGNRNLDFNGKKITVRSANGPADCNIDCQGLGRGFSFDSYEDANSVVKGFTIRNGTANNADGYGGAIELSFSSPTIADCVFLNNTASIGGGIECYGSSAQIINCLFQNNAADSYGGAVDCEESAPTIRNCTFFGNTASDNGGGAIFSSWNARPKVSNSIFVSNGQVAIYEYEAAFNNDVTTFDCLFYNNPDGDFYDNETFRIYTGANQLNAIPDGFVYDNISGDPLFKKGPLGNFYLSNKIAGQLTNSPCIDAGSASASSLGMDAYTTRTDNGFDSNTVDIGYHNYITSTTNYTLTTSVVGNYGSILPPTGNTYTYAAFTEVKLAATPNTGYKVKAWTGTDDNSSVDSNNVVTMTGNKTVTVEFIALGMRNLTTSVVGGHGTVLPVSGTQYDGTVVALTAIPDAGYQVKSWSGTNNDTSTSVNNTVTMNGDKTVTVTFVPSIVHLSVQVIGGNGTVTPRLGDFPVNSTITLTAYPRVGYKVVKWTGTTNDANDPNDPTNAIKTVKMDDNKTVTLQFGLRTKYQLTINAGVGGTVTPASGLYYEGDTITLTANPNANYMVQQWTGTDTVPGWSSKINTVKMTGPKTVSVQFQTFRTFNVPGNYPYLSIQDALNQANDGDVIVITPSVTPYVGTGFYVNKNVTIRSTNPSDPNVVAATVIDCTGELNRGERGFELYGSNGMGFVTLDGITLQNGNINVLGYFQPDPDAGDPGFGGGYFFGLGVTVVGNHVISNCIIRGFTLTANPAHDGIDGGVAKDAAGQPGTRPTDVRPNGGRGGEGTSLFGAGILIGSGSPIIKNTLVEDCHLVGGNGGNGGQGENGRIPFDANYPGGNGGSGGMPGRAYGAGIYCYSGTSPTFEKCIVRNCSVTGGKGGQGGNAGTGGANGQSGGYGGGTTSDIGQTDPSLHSANGAGVCVDAGASAVFKDCDFSNSIATGSITGVGGNDYPSNIQRQPHKYYQIPSFGGGVYCGGGSATQFINCGMQSNSNIADPNPGNVFDQYIGYGAGLCILNSSYTELTGCDLSNNNSPVGGGIYCSASADLHIGNTSFQSNLAQLGGGLYVTNSDGDINDCLIQGNTAAGTIDTNQVPTIEQFGLGGGLVCAAANVNILNCIINQNRSGGSGGGVYFAGQPSPLMKNCLIARNESGRDGAGVSCELLTEPNIANCTIADNTANGIGYQNTFGGGLNVADESSVNVKDSIIWGNQAINGSQIAVTSLNPNMPSYLTISYSNVLGGEADVFKDIASTLVWGTNNLNGGADYYPLGSNPNFVTGLLGRYYLSQPTVIEPLVVNSPINDPNVPTSPCVDAGSDMAEQLGLSGRSTRIDSRGDTQQVDMGYHFPGINTGVIFTLTTSVVGGNGRIEPASGLYYDGSGIGFYISLTAIPDTGWRVKAWHGTDNDSSKANNNTVSLNSNKTVTVEFELITLYQLTTTVIGGHGSIDPASGPYPGGTTVILTAIPDGGYRVKHWNGTDNDSLTAKKNEVTIDSNTVVTVEFEQTQVLQVPGQYSSIQQAFDAAKDGDTILVGMGVWGTSEGYTIGGKDVTLTSTNPDDPCVVANTIIQMIVPPNGGGWVGSAFTFFYVGPDTLLNGITIRGFHFRGSDGLAPTSPERDGENGSGVAGGAIRCIYKASPTVKNCIFDDCNVTGGNGSNGTNGSGTSPIDPNRHGGHGGWPGFALGGAIACLNNSNPAVINCTFTNCGARGGNGGDGGNGNATPNWGKGGRGGGWYYGFGHFWYGVPWTYGYHINDIFKINIQDINEIFSGEYDFYTRYSGHGGAVYVGTGCSPTFTHCNFVNNNSFSGVSGICGQDGSSMGRDEPSSRWIIDNSGGAVYCDTNSTPKFTDCVFNNNAADTNSSAANDDPHVSFGGAIAFENGAFPTIERCSFNGNNATAGGGVYVADATTQISDSNFIENTAYNGGALYCVDSNIGVANCNITGNQAAFLDSNDPNVATSIGQGGGIYCSSSDAMFFDCNILNNLADASGGGVYFGGQGDYLLHNCLLAENITGRDGGGVSANWYSNLRMANCTIANNMATGAGFGASYGGGLFCSYQNYTSVIDSILWNNSAGIGAQIAIGTGFEYDKRPSVVDVNYSDVQGGAASVYVDIGNPSNSADDCKLNWGTKNLTGSSLTNPKFVKGFYLSQPVTGDPIQISLGLSICVDKGSTNASLAGMYRHTTRTDNVPEVPDSIVDMGYHYVLSTNLVGNFNFDKYVNFLDYILFADHWMSTDCGFPDWCYGTDLDRNGVVNWGDFAIFAANYGTVPIKGPNEPNDPNANDHTPPSPSPMTWASVPTSAGATSITMRATTATDNSTGPNVEYYFQRTDGTDIADGTIRDWDPCSLYTDSTAVTGYQYGYRVKARDTTVNHNETGWSVIGYAIAGSVAVPIAPSGLTATVISSTQINLSWTDNSSNETGFKIERQTGGGSFSQIATVGTGVSNYNDASVSPSTTYTYRVRAYNGSGDSTYSNPVTVTTGSAGQGPAAPSSLTATVISGTQINLLWTDNSSDETGFKIERQTGGGSFSQIATVGANVRDYNDTSVSPSTTYTYQVRAYNGSGDSAYSNTISASTPQLPTPVIWYNPPPAVPVDGINSGQTKTDPNGSSSSYWWHKIVTPVPAGTPLVYYRFYCTSQSGFSSQWVPSNGTGNVVYPPIGSGNPNPVIKYGTNVITYCVPVTTGSVGLSLNWRVDVSFNSDGSGTQNHSSTVMIYAP